MNVEKEMEGLSVENETKIENSDKDNSVTSKDDAEVSFQDEGKPTKITMGLLQRCALTANFLQTASAEQAADALFSAKCIRYLKLLLIIFFLSISRATL